MVEAERVPLQMALIDVARLAGVERAVVSMWRLRHTASANPFPEPVARLGDEDRFDADAVVEWLESTGRGNNRSVREDAAAFAWPAVVTRDETSLNGVAALLCLKEIIGRRLTELADEELLALADKADRDDLFVASEIAALGDRRRLLSRYADLLADAAYNVADALERLVRQQARLLAPGHTAGVLHAAAHDLTVSLAAALAADASLEPAVYVDPTGGRGDLLVSLARRAPGAGGATFLTTADREAASREARRRLRAHGVHRESVTVDAEGVWAVSGPAVHVAQYPVPGRPAMTVEEILSAVDNLVLQMDDAQRALVIAPANVLSDRLHDRGADQVRDTLLRQGRIRAIARLPRGLVVAMPRHALALWVLGPPGDATRAEDRWTVVADLTDVDLDADVISGLVDDLVVALADWGMARAHAFRFARPVLTRSLLAGSGDLVPRRAAVVRRDRSSGSELAVRIAALRDDDVSAAPWDALRVEPRAPADDEVTVPTVTLGEAVEAGWVRLVPSNRFKPEELPEGTLRVIGLPEVTGAVRPGARGVDRLAFTALSTAGRLTEPGDVVFCASPQPAALVDGDGGSAVVMPARVLRITDPSGELVPDVLAADVNGVPAGARTWQKWPVRRVPTTERAPLAHALATIGRQRADAVRRLRQLEELEHLIVWGVATGSLTLTREDNRVEGP